MMTLLFMILMVWIFGKLIGVAFKAAWGISKVLFTLVFLPITLLGLVFVGLIKLAFPILAIVGLVTLIRTAGTKC